MEIIVNKQVYKFEDRLTIEQWQAVMQYDFMIPMNWPTIINKVTGVPLKLLIKGSQDTLELGAAIIVQMCNARQETKITPMDKLSFGEFIDLDSWIAMGTQNHLKDMGGILAPNSKYADEVLWAIEQWSNYRMWIFRQYAGLFDLDEQDETEPDPDVMPDPTSVARNWYKIIVDLANDDVLKLDDITELPLIKALNFMALRKEKQLEENMRIMEQNAKLKTPR